MKPSPKRPAAPRMPAAKPARSRARIGRETPDQPAGTALPPRVRRLMASPTWLPADRDADFLQQPDMRGIRLQLEYEKTELALQAAGVDHTVVVYGGSRTLPLAQARKRLAAARRALAAQPGDTALQAAVETATRLVERSTYYDMAREFGRIVGTARASATLPKLTIITGGGPGIMEAANRGASEAGAPSVGLNITLPHEQLPNPWQTPGLCFRFHYFAIRKLHLLERAKAAVFFPGGYGTLDELFEVLTLLQTRKVAPLPVVLAGGAFWRAAVNLEFLAAEGVVDASDAALFTYAESADGIWSAIRDWYAPRRTGSRRRA